MSEQAVLLELEKKPPSATERLEAIIASAVIAAERTHVPLAEIAIQLMEAQPELIAEWTKELLIKALAREQKRAAPAVIEQENLLLPGFERIPKVLSFGKKQRRVSMWNATYKDARTWLTLQRRKETEADEAAKKWVQLLKWYSEEIRPDITYREAAALGWAARAMGGRKCEVYEERASGEWFVRYLHKGADSSRFASRSFDSREEAEEFARVLEVAGSLRRKKKA